MLIIHRIFQNKCKDCYHYIILENIHKLKLYYKLFNTFTRTFKIIFFQNLLMLYCISKMFYYFLFPYNIHYSYKIPILFGVKKYKKNIYKQSYSISICYKFFSIEPTEISLLSFFEITPEKKNHSISILKAYKNYLFDLFFNIFNSVFLEKFAT